MASADPLTVQVLDYPQRANRDLPTGPLAGRIIDAGLHFTYAITFGADDPFIQDVEPSDQVMALLHRPANTCYRNAALSAVFNLAPFLNFLDQVAIVPNSRNVLLSSLGDMAQVVRRSLPREPRRNRQTRLSRPLESFWDHFTTDVPRRNDYREPSSLHPWAQNEDMQDPAEFIWTLFDRIATSDLDEMQVASDQR